MNHRLPGIAVRAVLNALLAALFIGLLLSIQPDPLPRRLSMAGSCAGMRCARACCADAACCAVSQQRQTTPLPTHATPGAETIQLGIADSRSSSFLHVLPPAARRFIACGVGTSGLAPPLLAVLCIRLI